MKKNQQSIDGFTPRRANSRARDVAKGGISPIIEKKPQPAEAKPQKDRRIKPHNSEADIERALQNLEIEESEEQARIEQKISKKQARLERKFEKANRKREKKGKKPLTFNGFKRRRLARRIFGLIFLLIIGAGGVYAYNKLKDTTKSFGGNILDAVLKKDELKTDDEGRTNILIFGTSPEGWDGQDLADSIMVASVNQETKQIYTVSLPRDLWVKHSCQGWLNTTAGKLNETYACGKYEAKNSGATDDEAEKAGQKALADKATEILGLKIQYQVHGNWQVLIDTINQIGGIDVKIEVWDGSPEMYDVATKVRYKNGETAHMDGAQALAFSRARGSHGGYGFSGGNFDRERNQQKILKAVVEKVNQQKYNPVTLLNIASSLGNNVRTSFVASELQTVANLAQEFNGSGVKSLPLVDQEDSSKNLMTTGMISGASAVMPSAGTYDYSDIRAYIAKNTLKSSASSENAKIVILNGTNLSGLAAEAKEKLSAEGYNITEIDSAPTRDYTQTKIYTTSDKTPKTADKLKSKYSGSSVESLPNSLSSYGEKADIVLVLGED